MLLKYTYDVGTLEGESRTYGIYLPNSISNQASITYDTLLALLTSDGAHLSTDSILSFYDENSGVYRMAKPRSVIPLHPITHIIIRNSRMTQQALLLRKLKLLETTLHTLEAQLAAFQPNTLRRQVSAPCQNTRLDIALLYAAPLIKLKLGKTKAVAIWNVDSQRERSLLLETLEKNKIGVSIRFETATLQNLKEVLETKPTVLHISSHGYFNDKRSRNEPEYVLALESSKEIGQLEEVNSARLAQFVTGDTSQTKVVVLSACYSEAISKVFESAGYKCIISVHKDCKVLDEAAQKFAVTLYSSLLEGMTIEDSFKKSRENLLSQQATLKETCCCSHIHKPDCTLFRRDDKQTSDIHETHTPDSSCKCQRVNSAYHDIDCDWARAFILKYSPNRKLTAEEEAKKQWCVCCCSSEIPHHEGDKFQIYPRDHLKIAPFKRKREKVEIFYHKDHNILPVSNIQVIGRQEHIKQLINLALKVRCLSIYGKSGVGKSTVVKHAANYAYERKMFKDGVIYLCFEGKNDSVFLIENLASKINLPGLKCKEEICRAIDTRHFLIIFDNVDGLMKHSNSEAISKINYLIERTQYPSFWVINNSQLRIEAAESFEIPELSTDSAKKLIRSLGTSSEVKRVFERLPKVLSITGKNPSSISQFLSLIREKSTEELDELLAQKPSTQLAQQDVFLKLIIDHLMYKNNHSLDLLKLLRSFPAGLYRVDLKYLCKNESYDWEAVIRSMLNNQDEEKEGWILSYKNGIYSLPYNVRICLKTRFDPTYSFSSSAILYLSKLSRALIIATLQASSFSSYDIRSNLQAFNAALGSGLWKPAFDSESTSIAQEIYEEISAENDIQDALKERFRKLESNFWKYTKHVYLRKIVHQPLQDSMKSALTELYICVATLLMLHSKLDEVAEILIRAKRCANYFVLPWMMSVIRLMSASHLLIRNYNLPKAIKLAQKALDVFSSNESEGGLYYSEGIADSKLLLSFLYQQNFANKPFKYKMFEIDYSIVPEYMKNAEDIYSKCENHLGKARAKLAMSEWMLSRGMTNERVYKDLKDSKKYFKSVKLNSLRLKCELAMGDWCIKKELWLCAHKKCIKGLKDAQVYKDREYEKLFNDRLASIFTSIKKNSKNVISILKSAPLVKFSTTTNKLEPAGAISRLPNTFNEELMEELKNKGKPVYLKFDLVSQEKIQSYLYGCRIMHFQSIIPSDSGIYFENEDHSASFLKLQEIKNLAVSDDLSNKFGLEMILFAMPMSKKLAEIFHKDLEVKYTVGFEFPLYSEGDELTQLQGVYYQAISIFCKKFYSFIVEGDTVKTSFNKARSIMKEYLNDNKLVKTHVRKTALKSVEDEDVYLICDDEIDDVIFQSDSESDEPKVPIDMTEPRVSTNITKYDTAFISRQIEAYEATKALRSVRCVNIYGQNGVGKTRFMTQVGWYLHVRNTHKDGIYYIDIRGIRSLDDFNKRLQEEGLLRSIDKDISNEFRDKDLLLILDNCDAMINEGPTFKALLHIFVNVCHNYIMFSSSSEFSCSSIKLETILLKKLIPIQSSALFQTVCKKVLNRGQTEKCHRMNIAQELTSVESLKECRGLPARIIELGDLYNLESDRDPTCSVFDTLKKDLNLSRYDSLKLTSEDSYSSEFSLSRNVSTFSNLDSISKEKIAEISDSDVSGSEVFLDNYVGVTLSTMNSTTEIPVLNHARTEVVPSPSSSSSSSGHSFESEQRSPRKQLRRRGSQAKKPKHKSGNSNRRFKPRKKVKYLTKESD